MTTAKKEQEAFNAKFGPSLKQLVQAMAQEIDEKRPAHLALALLHMLARVDRGIAVPAPASPQEGGAAAGADRVSRVEYHCRFPSCC